MWRPSASATSPVRSAARTVATKRLGNISGKRSSAWENERPSYSDPRSAAKIRRNSGRDSFSANVSTTSGRESPAESSATSSWLKRSSGKRAANGLANDGSARRGRAESTASPWARACSSADVSSGASSATVTRPSAPRSALISNCIGRSPTRDVCGLAGATRLAILAERPQVELAALAGRFVLVGLAPGVERDGLLEVRAVPLRLALRLGAEHGQALFGARIAADVQAVGIQRLLERVDLRLRDLHLASADLREISRRNVAREQPDDHQDHEQLEQREAARTSLSHARCDLTERL